MNKYINPFKYYRFIQDIALVFMKKIFKLNKSNTPRIFLFSVPIHDNLGDQAITYSELDFLKLNVPNYEVVVIYEDFYKEAVSKVKKVITKKDIIAIPGGGNMGDTWAKYEKERQYIVQEFQSFCNRIVSFPQSYSFSSSTFGIDLKEKAMATYSNHSNLRIYARETLSLEKMTENFDTKYPIKLVPDIVLRLDQRVYNIPRQGVMTVMRTDREKIEDSNKTRLMDYLVEKYDDIKVSDTVTDYIPNIISEKIRTKLLKKKWLEFSKSKVVVTDRLHGMIFAYITGTPVIVFDNNNHKVFNSYNNWLKEANYVHYANDYSELELKDLIDEYMAYDNFVGEPVLGDDNSEYAELIDAFKL